MISDRQYLELCRNGRPNDFRFLVERYQGAVYAFVSTRLNERTLAREATEEAFVRAYFALGTLRNPDAFHPWLLGIAGRVTLELGRKRVRDAHVVDCERADVAEEYSEPPPAGLDEAIAELPEAQRQVVLMRYFKRLSCREIAERLELPLGTVTKTLSRAYESLRAALAAQSETTATLEELK